MPVSNSVPCRECTMAPIEGCEVVPLMESMQQSTKSAPAAAAASWVATAVPAVSWVWTWIGTFGNLSLSAPMSNVAALGFRRPAMSLMASE